jgi:hypothetical protein
MYKRIEISDNKEPCPLVPVGEARALEVLQRSSVTGTKEPGKSRRRAQGSKRASSPSLGLGCPTRTLLLAGVEVQPGQGVEPGGPDLAAGGRLWSRDRSRSRSREEAAGILRQEGWRLGEEEERELDLGYDLEIPAQGQPGNLLEKQRALHQAWDVDLSNLDKAREGAECGGPGCQLSQPWGNTLPLVLGPTTCPEPALKRREKPGLYLNVPRGSDGSEGHC